MLVLYFELFLPTELVVVACNCLVFVVDLGSKFGGTKEREGYWVLPEKGRARELGDHGAWGEDGFSCVCVCVFERALRR